MHTPVFRNFQRRSVNNRNRDKDKNADRSYIFGTRIFGSDYNADWKAGTSEHRYVFWPISWPGSVGGGSDNAAYLHVEDKYGNASNTDRVGGPMMTLIFSSGSDNFSIVSDDFTVKLLANAIASNCTSLLPESFITNATASLEAYNGTPLPENVIQYYRSSSIALSSNAYTNNATYGAPGAPDTDVPNLVGLECFNQTIGYSAPLFTEPKTGMSLGLFIGALLGGFVFILVFLFLCSRGTKWYRSKFRPSA